MNEVVDVEIAFVGDDVEIEFVGDDVELEFVGDDVEHMQVLSENLGYDLHGGEQDP